MSRVAVLQGGRSLERGVSLKSGERVARALERLGHEVLAIDVGDDLVKRLLAGEPDVAFVALHGRDGEDGTVQELLESLQIPYTASGVAACIKCSDKVLAKHIMRDAGIPTPDFHAFNEVAFREFGAAQVLPAIAARLGYPLVIKPAAQGSALGVKFARAEAEVPTALLAAFSYDRKVLLERAVLGREMAVSVLDGDVLPIVEAVPREKDFYDFAARYEIGGTNFICPAQLEPATAARCTELAGAAYELLGCYGFARVDMMLDPEAGPQVLEVNAIPGLTDTSLLPQAADAAGIDFDSLVARIVASALQRG